MKKIWRLLKKQWLVIVASALVLVVLGVMALIWSLQPAQPTEVPAQAFIVPKGQAVKVIGNRLAEAHLIKQPLIFPVVVKWLGLGNKLQAGTFQLSPSWSVARIAQELTKGTTDVWVTIPEGWRREEIAAYLSKQELTEFDESVFLAKTASMEGKLFPDTYLVPHQITAEGLVAIFTVNFDKKIVQGLEAELEGKSLQKTLILASILEREAGDPEQMRQVAGVLQNRLDNNIALQVDASLQYIKGFSASENTWWATPLAADKQLSSPFNTYAHPGLPPAPIANPGVAAVKAALDPADSDYLYYIHDNQGKLHLAKTLAEHNANVAQYLR
jgi:UPF0755 protein